MSHGVSIPDEGLAVLPKGHLISKLPSVAFWVALLALLAGWFTSHDTTEWAFSYLTAFLYVASLSLGCLFFVIIQHAGRASWSVVVRRIAENYAALLGLMLLLFLPVWGERHELYHHWMSAHAHDDPILAGKAGYLNEGFWNIRAAIILGTWALMGFWFRRTSVIQDTMGGTKLTRSLERWSYRAIPVFALSLTAGAIDWGMSLDPHWFSTMWGVYYFAGSVVSGFALIAVTTVALLSSGLLREYINEEHLHDLGKLVFAFTVFWTYIAFSQYFLIWYANIPEETSWYHHRGGSWTGVGIILILCHFVLPFLFLLSRWRKRNLKTLALASVWMLFFHYIDLYYVVMPASPQGHHGLHFSVSDLLTVIGLLGVFLGTAAMLAPRAKLVPVKDPRLPESLSHVNF
jgi:hypothetical protein